MAVLCSAVPLSEARAQYLEPEPSRFPMDRNVPVGDRVVPGYEAPGVDIGAFTLHSTIAATTFYSDNVLTQETAARNDIALRIAPTLRLQSNWPVDRLSLTVATQVDRYASLTSENVERFDFDAGGFIEIGQDTTLRTRLRWQQLIEPRSSQFAFAQTLRPLEYQTFTSAVGVTHNFNRLRIIGELAAVKTDYSDGQLAGNSVLDTASRDNSTISARVRVEYAQSPAVSYFLQGTFNRRDFRASSILRPKRDSSGYEVLAGIRFEPSALARGEIGIGYLKQSFESPFYRNNANLGVAAKLQLFPTQLTTVTIGADRRVEDSGAPLSGAFLSTNVKARVDHELLRTLILGTSAEFEWARYNDIDRRDNRYGVGLRAEYRLNRVLSLDASATRFKVSSDGIDRYRDYRENRFQLTMSIKR